MAGGKKMKNIIRISVKGYCNAINLAAFPFCKRATPIKEL
jgi:hypothetical protein